VGNSGASKALGPVLDSSSAINVDNAAAFTASVKYPGVSTSAFVQKALDKHNAYRIRHGAGPLKWSNALAASAGASAARCRSNSGYGTSKAAAGENMYFAGVSSDRVQGLTQAIDSWYQESRMYDFKNPGLSATTQRFTQASTYTTQRFTQACDQYL